MQKKIQKMLGFRYHYIIVGLLSKQEFELKSTYCKIQSQNEKILDQFRTRFYGNFRLNRSFLGENRNFHIVGALKSRNLFCNPNPVSHQKLKNQTF